MDVIPTGLRGVDEDLHYGGLPAGSVVVFEHPPGSAGEAVLWTLVARGFHPHGPVPVAPDEVQFCRPDRIAYLTTGKTPTSVADGLATHTPDRTADDVGAPIDFEYLESPSDQLPAARVREPDADRPAVVVDSMSDLIDEAAGASMELVASVGSTVRERRGIAIHVVTRGDRRYRPRETTVLERSDAHLRFEPGSGRASPVLRFEHVRGGAGPIGGFPAVFDLNVGRRVAVDTVERG